MSANWIPAADMLASEGIIDFDAAAYLTGSRPRYAGSPQFPLTDMPNLNLSGPKSDVYDTKNNSIIKNPNWKKWLFAAIAIGGTVCGLGALMKNPSKAVSTAAASSKGFFSSCWTKLTGLFKKP